MEDVTNNCELSIHLQAIRNTVEQLVNENEGKSNEQLIAEINVIKSQLDDTRFFLESNNNTIL